MSVYGVSAFPQHTTTVCHQYESCITLFERGDDLLGPVDLYDVALLHWG